MSVDLDLLQRRVRVVARALGRHGLTQAWGHCSARIDEKSFLVCAPRAMGIIKPGEAGIVVEINAPLPVPRDGVEGLEDEGVDLSAKSDGTPPDTRR